MSDFIINVTPDPETIIEVGGAASTDHEALSNLQGGAANDHQHLTTEELDLVRELSGGIVAETASYLANPSAPDELWGFTDSMGPASYRFGALSLYGSDAIGSHDGNTWLDGNGFHGDGSGLTNLTVPRLDDGGFTFSFDGNGWLPNANVSISSSNGANYISDEGFFGDGSNLTNVTANTARYLNDVDQGASFNYNGFAWAPQQNHYIQSYSGNNGFNDDGFFGDGSNLTGVSAQVLGSPEPNNTFALYLGFPTGASGPSWRVMEGGLPISSPDGNTYFDDSGFHGDGSNLTGIVVETASFLENPTSEGDQFGLFIIGGEAGTAWSSNVGGAISSTNGNNYINNDGFHGDGGFLFGFAGNLGVDYSVHLQDNYGAGYQFFFDNGTTLSWRPNEDIPITSSNGLNGFNDTGFFGDGSNLTGTAFNLMVGYSYQSSALNYQAQPEAMLDFNPAVGAWRSMGAITNYASDAGINNYGLFGDGSQITNINAATADFATNAGAGGHGFTVWVDDGSGPETAQDLLVGNINGRIFDQYGNVEKALSIRGDFTTTFGWRSDVNSFAPNNDTNTTSSNGLNGFNDTGLFGDGSLITNISADFGDYNFQVFVDAGDGPETAQDLLVGNFNGRFFDQYGRANTALAAIDADYASIATDANTGFRVWYDDGSGPESSQDLLVGNNNNRFFDQFGNANFAVSASWSNQANTANQATLANQLLGPIITEASATPANNGELVFELTSDTSLTVKVKGSDGVVRSAVLALT